MVKYISYGSKKPKQLKNIKPFARLYLNGDGMTHQLFIDAENKDLWVKKIATYYCEETEWFKVKGSYHFFSKYTLEESNIIKSNAYNLVSDVPINFNNKCAHRFIMSYYLSYIKRFINRVDTVIKMMEKHYDSMEVSIDQVESYIKDYESSGVDIFEYDDVECLIPIHKFVTS